MRMTPIKSSVLTNNLINRIINFTIHLLIESFIGWVISLFQRSRHFIDTEKFCFELTHYFLPRYSQVPFMRETTNNVSSRPSNKFVVHAEQNRCK